MSTKPRRVTTHSLCQMKHSGQKISMLTAYDFTMASLLDQAGADILLVGDSLAMVVQGHETTIPATISQMVYHGEMVARAAQRAMVVVDLPFPHGQLGVRATLKTAAKVMKRTGCHAIKLEGGVEQAETIRSLVAAGIPVIAHVGLRPQSIHALGGYRVQRDGGRLLGDARAAEAAGAFCVLMECVPSELAKQVTETLGVPTIGIGAGPDCDGQVLVTHDILGLTLGRVPKFVRTQVNLADQIKQAIDQHQAAVRDGTFPNDSESFN
ncbi:MAG TPA: 3-methyl-2-oxobutanoate hydroxymethyltransferase [Planctomycetaceae bacterium]|nr:3-methyl-2-oxobutanoate hydroxymethyltransferase [Planctomycetaceae bacterium]